MPRCHHCKTEIKLPGKPSRSEECPVCRHDLRVCLNCRHYEAGAYRSCKESITEEVREKDRGNFCDWFQWRPDAGNPGTGKTGTTVEPDKPGLPGQKPKTDTRKAFDSLFGGD